MIGQTEPQDVNMSLAQNTPVQKENALDITQNLQHLAAQASQEIAITACCGPPAQTTKALTLCERAATAAAQGDVNNTQHAPIKSPLDKYTPGQDMPRVQDTFPATAIANIDLAVLDKWVNNEGMKILLIPFENKAHDPDLHADTCNKLFTAVKEITTLKKATITPSIANSTITKLRQMPITYLAHHLTKPEYDILIS
jgi:hypothetical protein